MFYVQSEKLHQPIFSKARCYPTFYTNLQNYFEFMLFAPLAGFD